MHFQISMSIMYLTFKRCHSFSGYKAAAIATAHFYSQTMVSKGLKVAGKCIVEGSYWNTLIL